MSLPYRFEAFVATDTDPKVGDQTQLATMEAVWSFINAHLKDSPNERTFWVHDLKLDRFARKALNGKDWSRYAPTPESFEDYLNDFLNW